MKITDILVHRLSIPLPRPVRTAIHDHAHADTVVVETAASARPGEALLVVSPDAVIDGPAHRP